MFDKIECDVRHYNTSKTKFMIIKTINQNLSNEFFQLELNNEKIERTSEYCYLGLTINETLNFSSHVIKVGKKICPYIGAIKRLRNYISNKALKAVYYAFVHSHPIYCLPVWGAVPDTYLNSLKTLQNKFMKNMLSLPHLTPTDTLYSSEILSLNQLTYYEAILFIYKVANGLIKCNVELSNQFIISNRTTRNAFNLRTPKFTMAITQKSIFYRGLALFNNIEYSEKN